MRTSRINGIRVFVGGVLAGALLLGIAALLMVASGRHWLPWLEPLSTLPPPQTVGVSLTGGLLNLAFGLWAVWLYAAIRPRYGPGPVTAVGAGVATWVLVAVVEAAFVLPGTISMRQTWISLGLFLVSMLAASLLGASIYQEEGGQEAVHPRPQAPARPAPPAKTAPPKTPRKTVPARPAPKTPSAAPPAAPAPKPPSAAPPPAPTPPASRPSPPQPPPPAPPKPPAPPSPPAAAPVPPPPAAPASGDSEVEAKREELQGSMMAMELSDEVAVREVLRAFNKGPLKVAEIVEHLSAVGWKFEGGEPTEAVTKALESLLGKEMAKRSGDGYLFSRPGQ